MLIRAWPPGRPQLSFGKKTDELLEPEKAFRFSARRRRRGRGALRHCRRLLHVPRFRFAAEGNPDLRLGAPQFPVGTRHKDEFFGETETYRKQVTIRIPAEGLGPSS